MKFHALAAAGGLALSLGAADAQPAHTDANGMPTNRSTPAEQAATAQLNSQVSAGNAAADATYQAQQRQYQNQLQQNRAMQQQYQDKNARYNALRARYAAERAAYHRAVWPDRYRTWVLVREDNLIGNRVSLISGTRVGTVRDVATKPDGTASGLLVELDGGKMVWIDANDVRRNRADGVVMTNLDRADILRMADQRL
ncbi:MAG: hypothetical protein BGN82_03645 [Alphaproteobacteria bacterium 65-7]|nr:MAG: hypothetical protein BGN82_03645 [Alphaproteobacteria bacterium 65-7]